MREREVRLAGNGSRWARAASLAIIACGIALWFLGLLLAWKSFVGWPPALPIEWGAAAEVDGPIETRILDLGFGRHRIEVQELGEREVVLVARLADTRRSPRVLMLRPGMVNAEVLARVECGGRPGVEHSFATPALPGRREVVPIDCRPGEADLRVILRSESPQPSLVIEELGFFESFRGLIRESRPVFGAMEDEFFYRVWLRGALQIVAILCLLLTLILRRRPHVPATVVYCSGIALAVTTLALWHERMPVDALADPTPVRVVAPGSGGEEPAILQPAAESAPLEHRAWVPREGADFQPLGGLLTTPADRQSAALEASVQALHPGTYEFRLSYTRHEGDVLLGVVGGERQAAVGQGVVVDASDSRVTQSLEVEMAAGESVKLVVGNNRPHDEGPSRVEIHRLEAEWRPQPSSNTPRRDLRVHLAAGPASWWAGSNETIGAYMGINLLSGNGPVVSPGDPPWHRMPGYALVTAIAALSADSREPLDVLVHSVFVHIALLVLAAGLFGCAMAKLEGPGLAALIVTILAFSPKWIRYTLVDGVLVSIALLIAAAGCAYLRASRDGSLQWWHDVSLHSSFALWFVMRPDVLPGWAFVTAMLAWRRWRKALVPLCLFLAIGGSWALFKHRHTGEFVMTTNSFGVSAMVGLWEVPNRFRWKVDDNAFLEWLGDEGLDYRTKAANRFATREVALFYLTYPGYVGVLAFNELVDFVELYAFSGQPAVEVPGWWGAEEPVLPILPAVSLRGRFTWLLLAAMTLSLVVGYKRGQTVLLGWAVWFNLPVFLLVYSGFGRFYLPAVVGLVTAGLALLLDGGFWRSLGQGKRRFRVGLPSRWGGPEWLRGGYLSLRAAIVIALFLLVGIWGVEIDAFLVEWEGLRYWTPFLEPGASTLTVLPEPPPAS